MEPSSGNASLKRSRSSCEEMGSFKIITDDPDTDAEEPTLNSFKKKIISEYKIVYNEVRQSNRHKTPSGVWKYFAMASKHGTSTGAAENSDEPDDRILCMLCYSQGRVHVYKSKTSSSNLWKHLNRKHDIEIPSEKLCLISASNFDGYFSERDVEEGNNSTDYTTSGLDDNKDGLIKTYDLEQIEEYQKVEHLQSMTMIEEDEQSVQTLSKYDACLSNVVHNDIGLAIIEEVAKRPILYQVQSSKQSSVRATRDLMWVEIYEALGEVIQIERIQKIWKNIRDRYKKIRNHEREGVECVPKYKYYEYLSFLDDNEDHLRPQTSDTAFDESTEKKPNTEDFSFLIEQTDGILSTVDDLVQSDSNYTTEDVISETSNCTVSSSNPPPITATIYPMEDHSANSENTDNPLSKRTPSPSPPAPTTAVAASSVSNIVTVQMDEFDLFGKLIANKLRSAPKDRVNLIEVKIMQAILENL